MTLWSSLMLRGPNCTGSGVSWNWSPRILSAASPMVPARSCSAVVAVWEGSVRIGLAHKTCLGPQPRTKVNHLDVIGIPFGDLCTRLCPLWESFHPAQVATPILTGSVCRVPSPAASFAMRTPPTKTSVVFRPWEFTCLIDVIGAVRRVQVGEFMLLLSAAGHACQDIKQAADKSTVGSLLLCLRA